jgi:hypothetical protein
MKQNIGKYSGSSVAAWLSETVLRGRGPGASGFESHRRGRIFSKEGTPLGHRYVCVFLPTPPRGRQGSNPGRMGLPWMLCCIVQKGERRREGGTARYLIGQATSHVLVAPVIVPVCSLGCTAAQKKTANTSVRAR